MERYAPNAKDLASRDVVSRSMTTEIMEGRGCGSRKDHIHLNLHHLDPKVLQEKLPELQNQQKYLPASMYERNQFPVQPTVHYNMGGIPTNIHGEVLNLDSKDNEVVVPGLMSIGEAACVSVHGANRLGSNSLLDLVVFGKSAANRCNSIIDRKRKNPEIKEHTVNKLIEDFENIRNSNGIKSVASIRLEMQHTMQNFCPVYRSEEKMLEGKNKLLSLLNDFKNIKINDQSLIWNTEVIEALELKNLLSQAIVSVDSALNRKESRGAHSRIDYSERDDKKWLKHSLIWANKEGKQRLDLEKLIFRLTQKK